MIRVLAILLLTQICAAEARAQSEAVAALELTDTAYRSLLPAAATLSDPDGLHDAERVLALYRSGALGRLETPYLNMFPHRGTYWAVFSVRNGTGAAGTWIVDLRRPFLLELDIRIDRGDGLTPLFTLGPGDEFGDRPFDSRYHGFPLALAAGETATVVIGYRSFATGWLSPHIGGVEAVLRILAEEDRANWLLTGFLLAMIAFTAVMLPVIGWRLAVGFAAYSGTCILFVVHADGYLLPLLDAGPGIDPDRLGLASALMMTLAALMLARTLFDTRRTQPAADPWYGRLAVLLVGALLVLPVAYRWEAYMFAGYLSVVAASLLHPFIGLVAWRQGQPGARPFLVGSPLIVGSLVYALLAHLVPGRFSIERTLDVAQATLVVEAFAFAIAILVRIRVLRAERDAATQQAMSEANARLLLLEALGDSERRQQETAAQAEAAQARLATIGHDIRQPLLSLRTTLDRLADLPEPTDRRMREAFAYMEGLARSAAPPRVEPAPRRDADAPEAFGIDVVLENAVAMFAQEAAEADVALSHDRSGLEVTARPMPLMRMVNNLVANAVRHAEARTVRVGVAAGPDGPWLEVADDGRGMPADMLAHVRDRGAKGEASDGDGLGLAIVEELSAREGLAFELVSAPGAGTRARLSLRTAAPDAPQDWAALSRSPSRSA